MPGGLRCYTWTKLLLDTDADLTAFDDPALKDIFGEGLLQLPPGKTAEDVCRDYLRGLYGFLVQTLQKRFSPEIFSVTPMECWITVPAIWSDKAQASTREAARSAGFASRPFDVVNVITEPEAAAITVLKTHMSRDHIDPINVSLVA